MTEDSVVWHIFKKRCVVSENYNMMTFYNELSIQLPIHQWGFSHSGSENLIRWRRLIYTKLSTVYYGNEEDEETKYSVHKDREALCYTQDSSFAKPSDSAKLRAIMELNIHFEKSIISFFYGHQETLRRS